MLPFYLSCLTHGVSQVPARTRVGLLGACRGAGRNGSTPLWGHNTPWLLKDSGKKRHPGFGSLRQRFSAGGDCESLDVWQHLDTLWVSLLEGRGPGVLLNTPGTEDCPAQWEGFWGGA